jgi:predicted RNase H-like HicB family nuclease
MAQKKQVPPTSRRKFKVLLIEETEGGYSVEVPELPGCFTEGDTFQQALENAREAIECYLDPQAPSQPRNVLVEEIEV